MLDIASLVLPVAAGPRVVTTAGGSGDAVQVTGNAIDTANLTTVAGNGPATYESVCFVVMATATLAAAETLTIIANIETSATSDFASRIDETGTLMVLTLTGPAGGGTVTGAGKLGVALEQCQQFVRVRFTPDLSATGTDTAAVQTIALFGGANIKP